MSDHPYAFAVPPLRLWPVPSEIKAADFMPVLDEALGAMGLALSEEQRLHLAAVLLHLRQGTLRGLFEHVCEEYIDSKERRMEVIRGLPGAHVVGQLAEEYETLAVQKNQATAIALTIEAARMAPPPTTLKERGK